jgi:hypothetical protein
MSLLRVRAFSPLVGQLDVEIEVAYCAGGAMTALREQMIQDMTLRGLSEKTQEAYLRTVSRLSEFKKTPQRSPGGSPCPPRRGVYVAP